MKGISMAKKKTIKIEEPVELKKAPLLRNNVPDPIPSVLSGLLRFSPDHIVRLIYDPDSKNFMLGDLTQDLVTEGVMGESGGGGIVNPLITITIDNTLPTPTPPYFPISLLTYQVDEQGRLGFLLMEPAYDNGTETKTAISLYDESTEVYKLEGLDNANLIGDNDPVFSDLVNCTYDDGKLIVTDPTAPASVTITVS